MKPISYFILMRPRQWLKNLMVFFPPFLSGVLFHPGVFIKGLLPFVAFCLASSATYIVNDLLDYDHDICHPQKRLRPLSAGEVTRRSSLLLAFVLLFTALAISCLVSYLFLLYVSLYLAVSTAYSLRLKHMPIFDIFCISSGFVLRLFGGGASFDVYISEWLFLTVFLLSIFLSAGKRYSEKRVLGAAAGDHRHTLNEYPEGFLGTLMSLSGAAVLVTYSLYVINRPLLVYTVPLCLFGLLRYMFMINSGSDGDPTSALTKDKLLLFVGIIWTFMVGLSVYL
jgi:4-hydroxybenzoate polyprenyltransferase